MEDQLIDKSLSTTVGRQIFVYVLSLLLPPLGLWPGIKYLKQKDEKSRMVGSIAILLTIVSTFWLTLGFINIFNQQLNQQLDNSLDWVNWLNW